MAKTIGIDLGTTNSCMAGARVRQPTVIENSEAGSHDPSSSAFTASASASSARVGQAPGRHQPAEHRFSIKLFMGRKGAKSRRRSRSFPTRASPAQRRRPLGSQRERFLAAGDLRDDPPNLRPTPKRIWARPSTLP